MPVAVSSAIYYKTRSLHCNRSAAARVALLFVFRRHSTGYPYRLADERWESSEKGNVCVFIVDKRCGVKDSVGKNAGD
jgi:hypothetical protein